MSSSTSKFNFAEGSDKSESYAGGCHCGFISFTVELSPPLGEQQVVNCNCSICRRAGYLLVYPLYEKLTWHNDSRARLSDYTFQTKSRDHMFCPKCGASIGIDFREMEPKRYGISVRSINNVDLDTLTLVKFNGLAFDGTKLTDTPFDLSGQTNQDTET